MMTQQEIMQILPHRAPFLFLDEIIEMEPGKRVSALWRLTGEEPFFKGHFPGNPVLPGVLMIESMAQAGAVAVLSMPEFRGKTGYMASVDGARFKRRVLPGDTLRLEVEVTKFRGPIGVGKGAAFVGDQRAAYCELMFAIE